MNGLRQKSSLHCILLIAIACGVGFSPSADAKPRKKSTKARLAQSAVVVPSSFTWPEAGKLASLDELIEKTKKNNKSPSAKKFIKINELLKKKRVKQAQQLLAGFENDSFYADHYWLNRATAFKLLADAAYDSRRYSDAEKNAENAVFAYQTLSNRYPGILAAKNTSDDWAMAEVLRAMALSQLGKQAEAAQLFDTGLQRLSLANALNQLTGEQIALFANTCKKGSVANRSMSCALWFNKWVGMFGKGSSEMKLLQKEIPDLFEHTQSFARASKLTQSYKTADADQQAFESAWALYKDEKWSASLQSFSKMLEDFPRSSFRFRVRYWIAQLLLRDGEKEKAQEQFSKISKESPYSYYGLLATQQLGKPLDQSLVENEKGAQSEEIKSQGVDFEFSLTSAEAIRLVRAQRFFAEGSKELAAQELKELKPREVHSSAFLMYLARLDYEVGQHSTGLQILTDLIQRGYPAVYLKEFIPLFYPTPFWALIKKQADLNQLDPVLVLSLIKQESAFDSAVSSSVGAIGLMQIMPTTAQSVEADLLLADLPTVENNLRIGCKYLKHLLLRFNGNIVFALAGYNAGPNAVDRWIKEGRSKKGMLEFIEQIPYRETRDYVGSIIRNHFWYTGFSLSGFETRDLTYFWKETVLPEPDTQSSEKANVSSN